jgi:hypothetical protein
MSSSDGVTDLVPTMDWFTDRFIDPSLLVSAPDIKSATMQNQATNLLIHLQTATAQAIQGSDLVAHLSFETTPNQSSAFAAWRRGRQCTGGCADHAG